MLPLHRRAEDLFIKNYSIRSSDVVSQSPRVNVEMNGQVLWYKTRELTETEIVESLIDASTHQLRWTIHRPKRGWYIRLRAPMFPPGSAISLLPAHTSAGGESVREISDSYLRFGCRTLVPSTASQGNAYPPSRSSLSSQSSILVGLPHEPSSAPKRAESMDVSMSTNPAHDITTQGDPPIASPPNGGSPPTSVTRSLSPLPEWQITHYILKEGEPEEGQFAHLHHHHHLRSQPSHAPHTSLLHRAIAPITRLSNSSSNHFYIVPETASSPSLPLIVFTDSTPVLSAIPSGTLTVDEQEIRVLGVEMAFWIAVSLAYLDYLRDRDGYLAASD